MWQKEKTWQNNRDEYNKLQLVLSYNVHGIHVNEGLFVFAFNLVIIVDFSQYMRYHRFPKNGGALLNHRQSAGTRHLRQILPSVNTESARA